MASVLARSALLRLLRSTDNGKQGPSTQIIRAGYRGFSPEATIVGDAETVAKAFNGLAQLGFTDVLIRNLVPDQDKALASIARLAKVKELMD